MEHGSGPIWQDWSLEQLAEWSEQQRKKFIEDQASLEKMRDLHRRIANIERYIQIRSSLRLQGTVGKKGR